MEQPVIDTAKLTDTATQIAKRVATNTAQGFMDNIDNTVGYARDLGVRSDIIDSFMATIKGFFQTIMSSLGLTAPVQEPAAPAVAAAAAPTTPANPAAAKAAAEAAAAGNTAAHCTDVLGNAAPCATPQAAPATGANVAK